jgi:hypothetical protein
MARVQAQGDRDFFADLRTGADDAESSKELLDQSELIEVFDAAVRVASESSSALPRSGPAAVKPAELFSVVREVANGHRGVLSK